jgi:hypothetical protein
MEPGSSLPHSQQPATCPYPQPAQSSPRPHLTSWRSILILSSHLRMSLPSGRLPSGNSKPTEHQVSEWEWQLDKRQNTVVTASFRVVTLLLSTGAVESLNTAYAMSEWSGTLGVLQVWVGRVVQPVEISKLKEVLESNSRGRRNWKNCFYYQPLHTVFFAPTCFGYVL